MVAARPNAIRRRATTERRRSAECIFAIEGLIDRYRVGILMLFDGPQTTVLPPFSKEWSS